MSTLLVASAATIAPRALFLQELEHWFRGRRTPKSSSEVMVAFGSGYHQTLGALNELVDAGVLVRSGLNRGTRYAHRCRAPATPERPLSGRWHERVRDVAVELHTFRFADARARLPELSDPTIRRWLTRLVRDGVLTVERTGSGNLYSYAPLPTSRPRAAQSTPSPRPGARPVAGTGHKRQPARREVRDLLREQRAEGRDVVTQKHGYAVVDDGTIVTSVPRTASDHRSLKNVEAALKRHDRQTYRDKPT